MPFVRPVTTQPNCVVAVQLAPPGNAVARYEVMGVLPSLRGAAHETTKDVFAGDADTLRGAPGSTAGSAATKLQFIVVEPFVPFQPSIAILYSVPATTAPSTLLHTTVEFASSFMPTTFS